VKDREADILSQINDPADLSGLSERQLSRLCDQIRDLIIPTVAANGGHLSSSLGVVELSCALHSVFESPRDKIIWDVGHQCYPHKILTGRRDEFDTIRTFKGLAGFCRRQESPHDIFGAGHASTSISAALGIATARDLKHEDYRVIAVIGDGGLSGGLAFEGLDNAGGSGRDIVVILNDNNMSISPSVGALSRHLTEIITHPLFERVKKDVWDLTEKLPKGTDPVRQLVRRIEESLKGFITPGLFFENLGFRYLGPIDGHKLSELIPVLERIKRMSGPILMHVVTQKGKGLPDAEDNPRKYHGVSPIKKESIKVETNPPQLSYTQVFGHAIMELGAKHPEVIAITAAMCDGTGLTEFAERYPERFFDVGIAEGHGVTFAGGMATEDIRPIFAVYSTFLQRAYDHIVHDIALQKLPVIVAVDRAGLVGEDGATHHGAFDISYLLSIPDLVIAAPRNGRELRDLLVTAHLYSGGPIAIRYPRGSVPDADALINDPLPLPIGRWERLVDGADGVILAVGTMVETALEASELLAARGICLSVINARFIKPIDTEMLSQLALERKYLITLEENSKHNGFGALVAAFLAEGGYAVNNGCQLLQLGLPDCFIGHGSRSQLLGSLGLLPAQVGERVAGFLGQNKDRTLRSGEAGPKVVESDMRTTT